jgi:hypothetical protein
MESKSIGYNNYHWYLFLISPFVATMLAIKNFRVSWAKNVLWAFIVFFGFTFGTAKEISNKTSSDIFRYTSEVSNLYRVNLTLKDINQLYKDNKDIDILRLTLAIAVSRLTDSARVLTTVYAFIFGFFFSRNIFFVLDRLKGKIKPLTWFLVIVFFLIVPFWNINGFRFYTATHIFLYGLLPFLFDKKRKALIFSALAFLVHFSFLVPIFLLAVYIVLGNRTLIYFVFFIASTISSEINIKSVNAFVDARIPKALSERTSNYRSDRQVKEYRKGTGTFDLSNASLHLKFYLKSLHWSLSAFLIFLFFKRRALAAMNPRLVNALAFTLLFWGLGNFMSSIPSGSRYVIVASIGAMPLVVFYLHYANTDKFFRNMVRFAVPALILFTLVSAREGFYFLTFNTFVANPLIAIFADYNFALNDFIK